MKDWLPFKIEKKARMFILITLFQYITGSPGQHNKA